MQILINTFISVSSDLLYRQKTQRNSQPAPKPKLRATTQHKLQPKYSPAIWTATYRQNVLKLWLFKSLQNYVNLPPIYHQFTTDLPTICPQFAHNSPKIHQQILIIFKKTWF